MVALQRCFPQLDKELRLIGMTRRILWEAYIKKFPDGFKYTQFCFYYNQWKARVNPTMHLYHKAGEKLSITDKDTGEVIEVEVFVAILSASQLAYVEGVLSQQKEGLKVRSNIGTYELPLPCSEN